MKVLLVHGYFLQLDLAEQKVMKPYPPLGLLYLSARLKEEHYEVEVFDGTFSDDQAFEATLKHFQPNIVGFYANMMTRHNVLRLNQLVKKRNIPSIVGGPDPPHYAESYLGHGFDVIVVGEGESTTLALLAAWETPISWGEINGLIFRQGENIVRTPLPRPKTPLDQFPFPDRSAINLNLYLDCWEKHHQQRPISLITSRGCPFQCTWCSHNVYGYSLRKRSPENVIEEMEWLANHYRFDSYWFADDVFTIQPKWNLAFLELLKQTPELIKPFECISRADKLPSEMIQVLKELSCKRVWVGAESGSQRLLDLMKRGVHRDQVIEVVRALRQAGIHTGMFFMWGFMDETLEDIEQTVNLASDCLPDLALTTVAYPIKGTRYYDSLADQDQLEERLPFHQGTDRDIQILNQASLETYAIANEYLHTSLGAARLRDGNYLQRLKSYLYLFRSKKAHRRLKIAFHNDHKKSSRRLAS